MEGLKWQKDNKILMNFNPMKKALFLFNNNIIVRVGLLSLTASSEGITLTAASNIIFAEVNSILIFYLLDALNSWNCNLLYNI